MKNILRIKNLISIRELIIKKILRTTLTQLLEYISDAGASIIILNKCATIHIIKIVLRYWFHSISTDFEIRLFINYFVSDKLRRDIAKYNTIRDYGS